MVDLDIEKLRQKLIKIYKAHLRNPEDNENKITAFRIYMTYFSAGVLLDESMGRAFYGLVDIGADTGAPKPTKEQVKKLLCALQKKVQV